MTAHTGARHSPGRQWWLVACLTVLSTLSFVDKNIIVLMLRPIQVDLGLSATEVTLAIGTAFALANLLIGIPAGWLADRFERRRVVFAAVLLWSLMAALCGCVTTFIALFLVRGGVGMAEGLLPPSSYSLIRDGVAEEMRARAFSVFAMSTLLGTGAAFVLGGLLIRFLSHLDLSNAPVLSSMKPWAMAITVIGLTGLPLSGLAFSFREPSRTATATGGAAKAGLGATLEMLWSRRRVCLPLAVFSVAHAMLTNSINVWLSPLLGNRFGLTPMQIGPIIGLLLLVMGPIGLIGAGTLIDRLARTGLPGPAIASIAASGLLLIFATLQPSAPSQSVFWLYQSLVLLGATTYLVVTSTLVATISPPEMTGKAISIFLVLQGAFGVGVAPAITAFATEHLFSHSLSPIAAAMTYVHGAFGVSALLASLILYFASGRLSHRAPSASS